MGSCSVAIVTEGCMIHITNNMKEYDTLYLIIGSALPVVTLILVVSCLYLLLRRRKIMIEKSSEAPNNHTATQAKKKDSLKKSNTSLKKDAQLKDNIATLANDTGKLYNEFKEIETYVVKNIKETTEESSKPENIVHN